MNCIHCKSEIINQSADKSRIIVCGMCTQRLVVRVMNEEGLEHPWIRSQERSKERNKRSKGRKLLRLKRIGRKRV